MTGGWVEKNFAFRQLLAKGYSVGGYVDKGVPKYTLYRVPNEHGGFKYDMVHEFDTPEELNLMVKLLLED